jgi:hypothetical protein
VGRYLLKYYKEMNIQLTQSQTDPNSLDDIDNKEDVVEAVDDYLIKRK